MTLSFTSPEIITTGEALAQLISRLEKESILAFDLEADSMHHYMEKVCLIQVSSREETALIDPLALDDLSALAPILADPAIRKVFHGADYDIRSLHRDFGIEVVNLFDTMIAAQFLGEPEIGLAAQLRKRFGVELDKRYQRADWSKRPLEPEMITYAASDTGYLILLYKQLEEELLNKVRLKWVEEECRLLTRVRMLSKPSEEPLYLRFKGASKMEPRTLAVLEELLQFRDRMAELRDRPPFMVLSTEVVRLLAEQKPQQLSDLRGVPGLSDRQVERYGKGILEVVGNGLSQPEESLPRYPRSPRPEKDRNQEARLKKLKQFRADKAAELGIEAGVLVNNALLETAATRLPKTLAELNAIPELRDWQKLVMGPELIELLREE